MGLWRDGAPPVIAGPGFPPQGYGLRAVAGLGGDLHMAGGPAYNSGLSQNDPPTGVVAREK